MEINFGYIINFDYVIATLTFWVSFAFSVGAFWTALMLAAPHMTLLKLYQHYMIYLFVGWLPVIVIIGLGVNIVYSFIGEYDYILHILGGCIIFYMAAKSLQTAKENKPFYFNWKAMSLVTYTNPKVWLTIPSGFLSAHYTDSSFINIGLFYALGVPIFLVAVFFWAIVGRIGVKISRKKFSYFTATLLFLFGVFLFYEGILKILKNFT